MNHLLTELWGLPELVPSFTENNIDENILTKLSSKDIETLIPQIGTRIKFIEKLEMWKTLNFAEIQFNVNNEPVEVLPEQVTPLNSADTSISENSSRQLSPLTTSTSSECRHTVLIEDDSDNDSGSLEQILDCNEGEEIKRTYRQKKIIKRRNLNKLIIDNELKDNPDKRISVCRFSNLSAQIKKLFPTEDPNTYFVKAYRNEDGKVVGHHGMLWDKYVNTRRKYRELEIISTKIKKSKLDKNIRQEIIEEGAEECSRWLEHNNAPFITVQEYWNLSRSFRLNEYIESNIQIEDYFKKYLPLQLPTGILLLEDDFNVLYPTKRNKLFDKWTSISEAIITIAKRKSCPIIKGILKNFKTELANNRTNEFLAILVFPLIFPNICRKSRGKKKFENYSRIEIKDSFILHVPDEEDLQQILEAREERYARLKITEQPLVIAVGKTEKDIRFAVKINKYMFDCETAVKALDLCFKSFFSLHAKYPNEGEQCFMYLQKHIYNIETDLDSYFVSLSAVKSDIDLVLNSNIPSENSETHL